MKHFTPARSACGVGAAWSVSGPATDFPCETANARLSNGRIGASRNTPGGLTDAFLRMTRGLEIRLVHLRDGTRMMDGLLTPGRRMCLKLPLMDGLFTLGTRIFI